MSGNTFLTEMGKRISDQRKKSGLTQEQVSEKINISIQSLSCIELGKKAIRPENLRNLCEALNVSADYILTGKRSEKQLSSIVKKLSLLSEEDFKIAENIINRLSKD